MAKVTVTFTDLPDGRVHVEAEFDPSVESEADMTSAQMAAILAIESMNKRKKKRKKHPG